MKPARSRQLRKTPGRYRSGSLTQDPVEVYCRVRPVPGSTVTCLTVVSSVVLQVSQPEGRDVYRNGLCCKETQYTFKRVYDEGSSQKDVFDTVALPLVAQLVAGKNGLLFAYGVTGSGKTFTMTGEMHNTGIMPRCLDVLFNTIRDCQARKFVFKPDRMNGFDIQNEVDAMLTCQKDLQYFNHGSKNPKMARRDEATDHEAFASRTPETTKVDTVDPDQMYAVFVTYIEIYNNSVRDLLDDSSDPRRPSSKMIREDGLHNMYVHSVTEVEVKSPEEAFEVFGKGQRRKKTEHTALNEESSRSHSIFTIRLVQGPVDMQGENLLQEKRLMTISQLSLVDLAGSERTNRTKNTGMRLREAGNINNSLMTLRTCMELLRENQQNGTNKIVPYRDSKLTHLFKNYFDGEGQVRMVVCVNPKADDHDETVQVLKFAEMTQEVQVARPTPRKLDPGLTPGRRRVAQMFKAHTFASNTEVKELNLDPCVLFNILPKFPPLELTSFDDDVCLATLIPYLEHRVRAREAAVEEIRTCEQNFRKNLTHRESQRLILRQEETGLKATLEQERNRVASLEEKLVACLEEKTDLTGKVEERDQLVRMLQENLEHKEMAMNQLSVEKEKLKEKCKANITEMKLQRAKDREEYQNICRTQEYKLRKMQGVLDMPNVTPRSLRSDNRNAGYAGDDADTPRTPLTTVNTQGTLYMPPHSAHRRGAAVSNPRHRRSKSAGGGDVWLDHRATNPVQLSTVLQPKMKKRKSVTKLTDMKDVANTKTSRYCLTTQEQDTDGELETKLYKGDIIPTCGGGVQVILNDVELLKQISPTAEGASRKRSLVDASASMADAQDRCSVAIEGHWKRPKS